MTSLEDFSNLTDVAWRRSFEAEHGLFVAEGRLTIERALAAGLKPRSVLSSEKFAAPLRELMPDVDFEILSDEHVQNITGYQVHRGALASFERPAPLSLDDLDANAKHVLVIEDLVDHENVGTLMRSAAGLGMDAVILSPTCADPLYRRSIKTSMGAVFSVPWIRGSSTRSILECLEVRGFEQIALTPIAEEKLEPETAFEPKVALWLGNEGNGLSAEILKLADRRVAISMFRDTDSINVAAAGAIAMWHAVQRRSDVGG